MHQLCGRNLRVEPTPGTNPEHLKDVGLSFSPAWDNHPPGVAIWKQGTA